MRSSSAIFSIRPRHAENIFCGKKTVELRRVRPKRLQEGAVVFVYVSSPQKVLQGAFRVANIVQQPIDKLWKLVRSKAHLSKTEYDSYFSGAREGVAIFISEVLYLHTPIKLEELRERKADFRPPQSFRYIRTEEIEVPLIHDAVSALG